jgi:hypothetical protein
MNDSVVDGVVVVEILIVGCNLQWYCTFTNERVSESKLSMQGKGG